MADGSMPKESRPTFAILLQLSSPKGKTITKKRASLHHCIGTPLTENLLIDQLFPWQEL